VRGAAIGRQKTTAGNIILEDNMEMALENTRVLMFSLYSGHPPITTKDIDEDYRAKLLERMQTYDASENSMRDWAAAWEDAERRLERLELSENEKLYLMAATMGNIEAGRGNQLVMQVEDTIIHEDPQVLSRDEVTSLANRIRSLGYFEQKVLMFKAKTWFDNNEA
jgi:hypothetical protein